MGGALGRLLFAMLCFGMANGMFMASLNNYLADVHHLDAQGRGLVEFPRELPGFAMVFLVGLMLTRLRETRLAAVAMVVSAAGALGLGLWPPSTAALIAFVFAWSLGDHIIIATKDAIGLQLARSGATGRRLGQMGAAINLGILAGSGVMWVTARAVGARYDIFYALAALCALMAGIALFAMPPAPHHAPSKRFVMRRRYGLYYGLCALFGMRKQIFLAFGAWLLIQEFSVPVRTIAALYLTAAAIGVVLRPLLGDIIDWLDERRVLAADAVALTAVCLAYAFAKDLWAFSTAKAILYVTFVVDSVLFSLQIAKNTYLHKIAASPQEITATMSLGTSVDHLVAMSVPLASGWLWIHWGYRWVFGMAAAAALAGLLLALAIRVPPRA